ncbi:MAG: hypothetical protein ACREI1_12445 [Nitrospiraceae bacterium]
MNVRQHRSLATEFSVLAAVLCLAVQIACADEPIPHAAIGTQTVGLAAGPFFPIRVLPSQSSKLYGTAVMPSWSMTITDPIGSNWYRGQVSLGAELLAFTTSEPLTAYGVGFTPKLQYSFVASTGMALHRRWRWSDMDRSRWPGAGATGGV